MRARIIHRSLFLIMVFILSLACVCAAEGEPIEKLPARVFMAGDVSPAAAIVDNSYASVAHLFAQNEKRVLMLDLQRPTYLDRVTVFMLPTTGDVQYQVAVGSGEQVGLSTDMLTWHELSTSNVQRRAVSNGMIEDIYQCDARPAQYIRLRFPEGKDIALAEIEAFPSTNYDLTIDSIVVSVNDTTAIIGFVTVPESSVQLIYGYNYDFVYERSLRQTMMDLSFKREHIMVLSGLTPLTSYRFQIRATDYLNKVVQSDFILFTTKAKGSISKSGKVSQL